MWSLNTLLPVAAISAEKPRLKVALLFLPLKETLHCPGKQKGWHKYILVLSTTTLVGPSCLSQNILVLLWKEKMEKSF